MKSICTLIFLFAISNLYAQNVGINDATPDAVLDVEGEARVSSGFLLVLGNTDGSRDWGMRADGEHFSLVEPEQADKEYFRITDDADMFFKPNGIDVMMLDGNTLRAGIGTLTPAQKLEVAGIVRLDPETHSGQDVNRLLTVDATGDVRANAESGFAVRDAVTYDISGRVVTPGNNSTFDLPGPLNGYTVTSQFTIYTTCDGSASPVTIHFKRYSTNLHSFAYSVGNGTVTTTNSNTASIPVNLGCGNKTITVSLNTATNALTFSITGAGVTGMYIQSGRTTFFRWL